MVSASDIESALDSLASQLLATEGNVSFINVMKMNETLAHAYVDDNAFYGAVAQQNPSARVSAVSIGQYINEYITEHSLRSLKEAHDSQLAVQLYQFYMRRFPSTLSALFQSATELGKGYAGAEPKSSLISDQAITPAFVQIAGNSDNPITKPYNITSSFKNPTTKWANTLSASGVSSDNAIGWIKPYFVLDTTLGVNELYDGSPNLSDVSTFVVLGVLDMNGQIDGISYSNADQIPSKPFYSPEGSVQLNDGINAHVVDNGLTLYVGKSTQGYVNVHFHTEFDFPETTAGTSTIDVDLRLLGQMFAVSPTIVTSQY